MILNFHADLNNLAKQITEVEAGKAQINIAQAKEVLAVISKMLAANPGLGVCLVEYGMKLFENDLGKKQFDVIAIERKKDVKKKPVKKARKK